jgi:hypothetical protein
MRMIHRCVPILLTAIIAVCLSRIGIAVPAPDTLPREISDDAFWRMITDFSESGGSFRFQFMSNEREFPLVIPELKKTTNPGGVYLGVGPEQNFSYIHALQPKIAFIFDIRPENMLEHLIYKAVFEMSPTRADFISRLFSRKRPAGLTDKSTVNALFQTYGSAAPDRQLFSQNLAAIKDHLLKVHHFPLPRSSESDIDDIYAAIFEAGPGTSSGNFFGRSVTYAELMTSIDAQGQLRSFLATDESYQFVRGMEQKNLIVPLVGDFAGTKAIRAVARYLKDHQATVSAFYTSNVEQYLFQQNDDWRHFYENVATLPVDSASTFVRSSHFAYTASGQRTDPLRGASYVMLRCSISDLLKAFNAGRIQTYDQMIRLSRQ